MSEEVLLANLVLTAIVTAASAILLFEFKRMQTAMTSAIRAKMEPMGMGEEAVMAAILDQTRKMDAYEAQLSAAGDEFSEVRQDTIKSLQAVLAQARKLDAQEAQLSALQASLAEVNVKLSRRRSSTTRSPTTTPSGSPTRRWSSVEKEADSKVGAKAVADVVLLKRGPKVSRSSNPLPATAVSRSPVQGPPPGDLLEEAEAFVAVCAAALAPPSTTRALGERVSGAGAGSGQAKGRGFRPR